jgi:hypothetical protein
MEEVLDVYHAPYDPQFPLVCMDESNKQLVGEVHAPLGDNRDVEPLIKVLGDATPMFDEIQFCHWVSLEIQERWSPCSASW